MTKRTEAPPATPTVELGINGWRVPLHSHIAYLWETEADFARAVGFLEAGFRDAEQSVVLGSQCEIERTLAVLESHGFDVAGPEVRQRLRVLARSERAPEWLENVEAAFRAELAAGASVVRLFGSAGWGREGEPADAELLAFEARLTEVVARFPAVILCLHEVPALTGLVMRHGVLGTHPQVMETGAVLLNPLVVPLDRLLPRLPAIAAELATRQREREALERAEEELRASHEEMRALAERLRVVREEESARIAREVHDEVGQMLTALGMDVAWLENRLDELPQPMRQERTEKLRSMARLVDTTVDAVQRIVTELRPGILDELGLEAAVEWYVGEFEKRTGIRCRLRSSFGEVTLEPARSTALFRILQEALTNVARHAGATAVEIRLAIEDSRVVLAVSDNGRGIPEERLADPRSLGLIGMRERARSLGGDLVLRRLPAGGTTVEVVVPR